jgi:hypothetical protein
VVETVVAVVVDAVVAVCKTNEENAILTVNLALTRVALNPLRNAKVAVRTTGEASKTKLRANWSLLSLKRLSRESLKPSLLPKQLKSSK